MLLTHSNSHLGTLAHPSTPKMLRAKECIPTPFSSVVFTFELVFKSYKEFVGASIWILELEMLCLKQRCSIGMALLIELQIEAWEILAMHICIMICSIGQL